MEAGIRWSGGRGGSGEKEGKERGRGVAGWREARQGEARKRKGEEVNRKVKRK